MSNTALSLDVSTSLAPKVMRLYDTSFYHADERVDNYLIEVLPVNKNVWVTFPVRKGFSLVLNSSNLKYKVVAEKTQLIDLPDGIYEFKQSYKPNTFTLKHFYHLRIVQLLRDVNEQRSKLLGDKCRLKKSEFVENRDVLRDIEEYAMSAKWMVEEEADKVKGKELYEWAQKRLQRYGNECKC